MILNTQRLKLCCYSNMSSIPKPGVWTPCFTERLQVLNFYILAARSKFFNLCTKNPSERHSFLYSFISPQSCCTTHVNTKWTSLVSPYMGTQSELILFHRICGHRLNVIHRTRYNTKWMILMVLDMAQGVRLNPDDHKIVIWFVKLNLACLKTMWVGLETLVGASLL
jgi:hypothetical protein